MNRILCSLVMTSLLSTGFNATAFAQTNEEEDIAFTRPQHTEHKDYQVVTVVDSPSLTTPLVVGGIIAVFILQRCYWKNRLSAVKSEQSSTVHRLQDEVEILREANTRLATELGAGTTARGELQGRYDALNRRLADLSREQPSIPYSEMQKMLDGQIHNRPAAEGPRLDQLRAVFEAGVRACGRTCETSPPRRR